MHKHIRCAISRVYNTYHEAIQIGGYLVMLGTIGCALYQGFQFIQSANANTQAISELQTWKSDTSIGLARLEQKIDDIYLVTVGKRP